jgi:hypothetical protein
MPRLYVMNEHGVEVGGVEVRGAHPSKIAKGEAAAIVVVQRWASPQVLTLMILMVT